MINLPVMDWTEISKAQYDLLIKRRYDLAHKLGYDSIIVLVEGSTNQRLTSVAIEQVDQMLKKLEQDHIERAKKTKEREAKKQEADRIRKEKKELEILKKAEEIKAKLSKKSK